MSTERSYALTRRLANEEGILAGVSSGAALAACLDLAARIREGVIVTVFPDSGTRYLTERFWEGRSAMSRAYGHQDHERRSTPSARTASTRFPTSAAAR